MNEYTFTGDQLYSLLSGAIEMFQENQQAHGMSEDRARASAILEMLDGLDAERELLSNAEIEPEQLTQIINPKTVCAACYADYEQSGIENT